MNQKEIKMISNFYKKLGLNRVKLTDETVREFNEFNADVDVEQLRQKLLNNFYNAYNAGISTLVGRFMVADATINKMSWNETTWKNVCNMFENMLKARYILFTVIVYWLDKHNIHYNYEELWDELRKLTTGDE